MERKRWRQSVAKSNAIGLDSRGPEVYLMRLPEVAGRTGRCRSAIYRGIAEGTFPAPVAIGERARAWRSDEIAAWIAERIQASERAA